MSIDMYMVTRAVGVVRAESIKRPAVPPEGQAWLAGLRARTAGEAGALFRSGHAVVSLHATVRQKLRFELAIPTGPGPKPLMVVVNESVRRLTGWKLGAPWGVAFAALSDDAEQVCWDTAVKMAWKLEGVRLTAAPDRVPWCIVIASPDADLPAFTDLMTCVLEAVHAELPTVAPIGLGGV